VFQISLFFSAQHLARETSSGHSGVRSPPKRRAPAKTNFWIRLWKRRHSH